jgi:preprotein translocase subunit SecY
MFEKIRTIFTIPELRRKVLLTLFMLAIYRVGWQVYLPIVNPDEMRHQADKGAGQGGLADIFNQVAIFSASQLNVVTIFGLGIMPYISASIIFQLLGSVWEPLEKLRKEGESGQKKINEYTRYLTVFICLIQTWGYVKFYLLMDNGKMVNAAFLDQTTHSVHFGWIVVTILTMTAGTIFLMWLGEQIDEFGIGNGISLLIMAGILARMPAAAGEMLKDTRFELGNSGGKKGIEVLIGLVVLFVGVVAGVVYIDRAQRRIPTQHAKHVRGRRVFGGTREYLPLRVNQSGVMPIIFASSLLLFPQMIFGWAEQASTTGMWHSLWENLHGALARGSSFTYNVLYIVLIYFFCYFWTAITFNPKEMADNMKDHGTFIPGYRPGRRTSDHLERVMVRITYVGAGYLAIVAITPTIVGSLMGVPPNVSSFFGGTGLLIIVSVAFDLVQQIDSHLIMRNYKGLLE